MMTGPLAPVKVFIRDEAYAWVPGSMVFIKEGQAFVRVELPANWHRSTVLCQDSDLEEIEDALIGKNIDSRAINAFRAVPLASYPNHHLPLQNLCGHKSDMADLPQLHEAAMLYNLKERNFLGLPYTRVRDIIVAVNPFERLEGLYSPATQQLYADKLIWGAPTKEEEKKDDIITSFGSDYDKLGFEPHCYEVSCLAYKGLAVDGTDQTILVSGESGAGKTETVKIVLQNLATLEQTRPGGSSQSVNNTVQKLLQSSPVFEAFGNAKTPRNNNSSRFGKFTQLQFSVEPFDPNIKNGQSIPTCYLTGSSCTTYLLEKSRVVSYSAGERNYHIFYHLLAAPDDFKDDLWEPFASCGPDDFAYLANSADCTVDGMSDDSLWERTVQSLAAFQIQGEALNMLMRALVIVLQLGNLTFDDDRQIGDDSGTVVSSLIELDKLCDLIGVSNDEVEAALTSRVIKTSQEEVKAKHQPAVAKEATDALAKEMYARIFDFIVRKVNRETNATSNTEKCGTISLLDIYGFERLDDNRFEQLCINYANEQLHQKYVVDNFRPLKEEYDQEGIDIFDFSLIDNSSVLDLLEGRNGIFTALQEECTRPMGNDESFIYKTKIVHKLHDRLISEKLHTKTEFGIQHFAGPVTYDATHFVVRNNDKLPIGVIRCAAKSTNPLIRAEFLGLLKKQEDLAEDISLKKKGKTTIIQKFSKELRDLLAAMEKTQTRYIRCIIPNEAKTPRLTNHLVTLRQLEYAGLMTAVALSRESYPDRLTYKTILRRFDRLLTKGDRNQMKGLDLADKIVYLLSRLFDSMMEEDISGKTSMPFACGKTKVYLRAGALEHLETLRHNLLSQQATLVQKWIRRVQAEEKFKSFRRKAILIQAFLREIQFRKMKSAATLVTTCFRKYMAVRLVQQLRPELAVISLQSQVRAMCKRRDFMRLRRSVVRLQRAFRTIARLKIIAVGDPVAGMIVKLKERVEMRRESLPRDRLIEHALLADVDRTLCVLGDERMSHVEKIEYLEDSLQLSEEANRRLLMILQSAEAATKSSTLEAAAMQKANDSLTSEIHQLKEQLKTLGQDMRKLRHDHKTSMEETKRKAMDCDKKDSEIIGLKDALDHQKSDAKREKESLETKIRHLRKNHRVEIEAFRAEFTDTQESHREYLANLIGVLETANTKRAADTAQIAEELELIREERDRRIRKLEEELEVVKQTHRSTRVELPSITEGFDAAELQFMRLKGEENDLSRLERAKAFNTTLKKLQLAVKPENMKYIMNKVKKHHGLSVEKRVYEEIHKMAGILGELYAEETLNKEKINQKTLALLETCAAASNPEQAVKDLQLRLLVVEKKNTKLAKLIRAKESRPCERCSMRDKRRSTASECSYDDWSSLAEWTMRDRSG